MFIYELRIFYEYTNSYIRALFVIRSYFNMAKMDWNAPEWESLMTRRSYS